MTTSTINLIIGAYLQKHLTGKAMSYSGRNMYGEECLGFTYDGYNSYLCDCIDLVLGLDPDNKDLLTPKTLGTFLTSSNQDAMGRYDLIFYFTMLKFDPALSPANENKDEDDDDDDDEDPVTYFNKLYQSD